MINSIRTENDWTSQSLRIKVGGGEELKHKGSDTSEHRKRLFNILQTEWISMRFSTGSYNIQVKGIRSCRQLKVVPKKYSLLSVRWILVVENRGSRSMDHGQTFPGCFAIAVSQWNQGTRSLDLRFLFPFNICRF